MPQEKKQSGRQASKLPSEAELEKQRLTVERDLQLMQMRQRRRGTRDRI
jgi:hypothetical protein